MKRIALIVTAALLVVGVGVPALVHKVAAVDSPPSGVTAPVETFTGRVVRMDLNAGTFTVRRQDKVITLNAGGVDLKAREARRARHRDVFQRHRSQSPGDQRYPVGIVSEAELRFGLRGEI